MKRVERLFRRLVVYPALRLFFRNRVINSPLNLSAVRSILVFRYDRIGDMIVTLPVLKALKRRNPSCTIAVLASRSNAELVREASFVDEHYVVEHRWVNVIRQILTLRRRRYDVILNFIFNRTTGPALLANLVAPEGVKIGQGPERYAFYFNRLLQMPRFERPMSEQLALFISDSFGITVSPEELVQEIEITAIQHGVVDSWLRANNLRRRSQREYDAAPYVVFNLSAQDSSRKITRLQAGAVASCLSRYSDFRVVIIHAPDDDVMTLGMKEERVFDTCLKFQAGDDAPLHLLASLIAGAVAVVSPETSIVHFAAAMGTPVFGIYGEHHGVEWKPYGVAHAIVESEQGCTASSIDPESIIRGVQEFLSQMKVSGEQGSGE